MAEFFAGSQLAFSILLIPFLIVIGGHHPHLQWLRRQWLAQKYHFGSWLHLEGMLLKQIENYKGDERAVFVYTFTRGNIDEVHEVMELLAAGNSMKQIASQLGISIQTCSKHRTRVLEKMDVSNDVELVRLLLVADG